MNTAMPLNLQDKDILLLLHLLLYLTARLAVNVAKTFNKYQETFMVIKGTNNYLAFLLGVS
jgi:hypothetical protein